MIHSIVQKRILGVIPARFASSRFPGKALALIGGRPMIQHVWERTRRARYLSEVLIATDDDRIASCVRSFGGKVCLTSGEHLSGTDRVAEIAWSNIANLYVNIQGDEPLIDPDAIDAAILSVDSDDDVVMGTLKKRITDPAEIADPNVVKVVTNLAGDAIYFSRSSIPFDRNPRSGQPVFYKHVGLYVYRRDFLLRFSDLPVGPLEASERLEQLRALENGFRIRVGLTEYESFGVDVPADLNRVNQLFALESFR